MILTSPHMPDDVQPPISFRPFYIIILNLLRAFAYAPDHHDSNGISMSSVRPKLRELKIDIKFDFVDALWPQPIEFCCEELYATTTLNKKK